MVSLAEQHHQAALAHLGQGELDSALDSIEKALAADYSWAASHATHGLVLASQGGKREAERAISAALKLDPALPYAHFASGVLLQDDDPAKAIAAFERALAGEPENPRYHLQLALAHLRQGDVARARPKLESALALDSDNLTALILMADLALSDGRREDAAVWTDRVLEVAPDHDEALMVRARLALMQGDGPRLRDCANALLQSGEARQQAAEWKAIAGYAENPIWRPWWSFLCWRARSSPKVLSFLALVIIVGILVASVVMVLISPVSAVLLHICLWSVFGYVLLCALHHRRQVAKFRAEEQPIPRPLSGEEEQQEEQPARPKRSGRTGQTRRSKSRSRPRTIH